MVDQRRIDDQRYVDARTAAARLGIQVRSLYAYVSRGQVRSIAGVRGRPRLYALADLERLRVRRDARAGHSAVAAGALRWGEPVLDSAITAITPLGPAYRGRLAIGLVDSQRFENVAELLWSGYLPTAPVTWPRVACALAPLGRLIAGADPLEAMGMVLALARRGAREPVDDRPDQLIARGRELIPLLAACLAARRGGEFDAARFARAHAAPTVAVTCARALDLDDAAAPLLERALILLADHELNASSFAARIAASTGADLIACMTAALATLSGPRHGNAVLPVLAFAESIGGPEHVPSAIRALRRQGRLPPGFGHQIYPGGDPRAQSLLDAIRALPSPRKLARTLLAIADAAHDAHPSSDVGLAALTAALGAPREAGAGLFAVARTAGWVAHVIEQRAAAELLRPRARYVGVAVESLGAQPLVATPLAAAGSNSAFDTGNPRSTKVSTTPGVTYALGKNKK